MANLSLRIPDHQDQGWGPRPFSPSPSAQRHIKNRLSHTGTHIEKLQEAFERHTAQGLKKLIKECFKIEKTLTSDQKKWGLLAFDSEVSLKANYHLADIYDTIGRAYFALGELKEPFSAEQFRSFDRAVDYRILKAVQLLETIQEDAYKYPEIFADIQYTGLKIRIEQAMSNVFHVEMLKEKRDLKRGREMIHETLQELDFVLPEISKVADPEDMKYLNKMAKRAIREATSLRRDIKNILRPGVAGTV